MLKTAVDVNVAERSIESKTIAAPAPKTLPPQKAAWRTIFKGRMMMHYHRLIALVVLANAVYLWVAIQQGLLVTSTGLSLPLLSNLVVVNISVGVLIRSQHVINFLFKAATSVPTSWPLAIRHQLGKVYHFGGIHVGGTVMGTVWYAVFVVALFAQFFTNSAAVPVSLLVVTGLMLALLFGIIAMALPPFRAKFHNSFEAMHRLGGWTSLVLFWAQTLIFANMLSGELTFAQTLFSSLGFWLLLLVTFSVALPWMRLRKVSVDIVNPSNHVALARFNYGVTPFAGSSTALSRNPLLEWHSFANVPSPGEDGFRLTISRAGDWTGGFIDDLPEKIWVKGIPTAGVGNIDKLFKRVVWIATGSGIGPTLPHLLSQEVPAQLVWSTRTPRKTYGDDLVDEILAVQPDALIWDTNENGRPDLVQLAWEAVQEFDAEAVICISNKKLTWQVVYGMESRGIPAYGAIWDS